MLSNEHQRSSSLLATDTSAVTCPSYMMYLPCSRSWLLVTAQYHQAMSDALSTPSPSMFCWDTIEGLTIGLWNCLSADIHWNHEPAMQICETVAVGSCPAQGELPQPAGAVGEAMPSWNTMSIWVLPWFWYVTEIDTSHILGKTLTLCTKIEMTFMPCFTPAALLRWDRLWNELYTKVETMHHWVYGAKAISSPGTNSTSL